MSGFVGNIERVLLRPDRMIGSMVADVTLEEDGIDELVTTDHPVEKTADITDHAYKRPAEVTLHVLWSNSALGLGSLTETINEQRSADVYKQLLAMQYGRVPFTIVTGKRTYQNMLLIGIAQHTDRASEYALDVSLRCREVIIVSTQTTNLPPQENHASPEDTAPTQPQGQQAPAAQPESILHRVFG